MTLYLVFQSRLASDLYLSEHSDYIFSSPEGMKGTWKQLLGGGELHLEIGMGKGDYLIAMSDMYPGECWVGLEKDESAAATAARKALEDENHKKENNRMIFADAGDLAEWFAPHEIDVIHLNFSDPWPKKYTHKRRLSGERFLRIYKELLAPDGYVRMKTDNKDLFEDSLLYFLENGFTITGFSVDFRRKDHPEDAASEYERRFMALGQPIYMLKASLTKLNKTE